MTYFCHKKLIKAIIIVIIIIIIIMIIIIIIIILLWLLHCTAGVRRLLERWRAARRRLPIQTTATVAMSLSIYIYIERDMATVAVV